MNWLDILCTAAVLGAAGWALIRIFRRHKSGKCTGCPTERPGRCSSARRCSGREKN